MVIHRSEGEGSTNEGNIEISFRVTTGEPQSVRQVRGPSGTEKGVRTRHPIIALYC
jgi:hypothetical protein